LQDLAGDVFFPPKVQDPTVRELSIIHNTIPCAFAVDEWLSDDVSLVGEAQQRFHVGVFVLGVGESRR
jgi:hypothetical protein